jgi:putative endonuclease
MYTVYILKSINGKYYIGCTDSIERRFKEHNSGMSKYTKDKGPWNLVYKEEFATLSEARKREKQIKSWKKRVAIEKLINNAAFV